MFLDCAHSRFVGILTLAKKIISTNCCEDSLFAAQAQSRHSTQDAIASTPGTSANIVEGSSKLRRSKLLGAGAFALRFGFLLWRFEIHGQHFEFHLNIHL